ncbi:MAG: transcription antitermination factor NusB [Elusimicrobia bacterium]|nr:transcription antitermination factor NusB [Elusimicrobiota bacterium]
MGVRRQAREAALQILYLVDIGGLSPEQAAGSFWVENQLPARARTFADDLASGALSHRKELDVLITKYAENWEISRMAAIDRNILRMAAFELLHHKETPVSVVIDEAVEIAKTYSTQDSGKFVNGILDKIKLERPPA